MHRRPALAAALFAVLAASGPVPAVRTAWLAETDGDAERQLAALPALAADGQWDEIAGRIERVRTLAAGRVVRIDPRRRVAAGTACDLALLRSPPPVLAAWRGLVRGRAEELFARGTDPFDPDPAALRSLVRDLFLTEFGDDAADRLAETAWRRGQTDAARLLWSRLIPLGAADTGGATDAGGAAVVRHPDADRTPGELAARLILCDLAAGRQTTARRERAVFRARFGAAVGTLAGRTGVLADLLDDLAAPSQWTDAARPRATRTLGATPGRGGVLRTFPQPRGVAWARRSPAGRPPGDPGRPFAPHPPTVVPAVWRDTLLFADAGAVYALDAAAGRARWPLTEEDDADAAAPPGDRLFPPPVPGGNGTDADPPPFIAVAGPVRHTVTVAGHRLFARLGRPIVDPVPGPAAVGFGRLVCLDLRREGDLIWSRNPESWGPPGEPWSVEGTPAVVGDRAFVTLRRGRPGVRLDLACLSVADGAELWRTPLGSPLPAAGDGTAVGGGIVPTVAACRAWVPTGSGAVVCCDAADGRLLWITEYPRDPSAPPAAVRPAVFAAGLLLVTPDDAASDGAEGLLALDAEGGLPLWSLPASVVDPAARFGGPLPEVLGVAGDTVIVTGRGAAGFDPLTGEARWRYSPTAADDFAHGRGLPAGDRLVLPTRTAVRVFDAATGEQTGTLPLRPLGLSGGNLAGDGGRLFGHAAGTVFGSGEDAWRLPPDERRARVELPILPRPPSRRLVVGPTTSRRLGGRE